MAKTAIKLDREISPPFLRTEYNYDRDAASDAHGLKCEDKTLAQQQFKDQCDINVLFARYLETGTMPQVDDSRYYGDFTGIFDFQTAMNEIRLAQENFSQLPARIKNRFDNDPAKLIAFLENPENREEAEFLQILQKRDITPGPNIGTTGDFNGPPDQPESAPAPRKTAKGGPPSGGTPTGKTATPED